MLYFLIASIFFNCILVYYCIKFGIIIINVQESIEECLDIIDEKYSKIVKILEIPIFFDSPEIKRLLNELKHIKLSILYIANKLSLEDLRDDEEKEEDIE
tara:strand:- start:565 stop:864 length:300 start_codon:yes stop_codon:yes gene_type:complete